MIAIPGENDAPMRTMGHIALHYPEREAGPPAARLLSLIGFVETQMLPLPTGNFYRFVVHEGHRGRGDGILYLSCVPPAQAALMAAAREALGLGTPQAHPAIAALRSAMDADPEYMFHVGTLVGSLEELERITADLRALEDDPDFRGRLRISINRPQPGDREIDARLDASPVFGGVTRHAYGRNGVQVFVETDLLSGGPLGESMVLELDYVFPGKDSHILSVVEL